MGRLDGLVAVVTGAASGLGRATALMYGTEGANVACVDLDADGAAAAADEIRAAGGDATSWQADLAEWEAAETTTAQVLERYGQVDVIYACAGIAGVGSPVDTERAQWERVLAVDLTSKWLSFRFALPAMIERGRGSVIVQTSIAALVGVRGVFPYSVAKGGCAAMVRQAAAELGPSGIRVNGIAPGLVPTPLAREAYEAGAGMLSDRGFDQAMVEAPERYPLRRLGTPEEIAYLATYLGGDESAWTTGQIFVVDGGVTAT